MTSSPMGFVGRHGSLRRDLRRDLRRGRASAKPSVWRATNALLIQLEQSSSGNRVGPSRGRSTVESTASDLPEPFVTFFGSLRAAGHQCRENDHSYNKGFTREGTLEYRSFVPWAHLSGG